MTNFYKDQIIFRHEVEYRVIRTIDKHEVQLEKASTGEYSKEKIFNLLKEYTDGTLLTKPKSKHANATGAKRSTRGANMHQLSDAARIETRRRIEYLHELDKSGSFSKPKTELIKDIEFISKMRGEVRPPHITTVYRWKLRYDRSHQDLKALICAFEKKGGKGSGRLHPEVEAAIFEEIESTFLASRRCSAEDVRDAVCLKLHKLNSDRTESEQLEEPSLRTIQRRLGELWAFDLAVARYGKKEAERRFANSLGARATHHILQLAEIDHSPVDLLVVNEDRIVIGRPTITVILDRYSRCVLGYHLSLAGHGVDAVFAALSHALMPKTYLKDAYSDLDLQWNCFGWFTTALMDNGSEFHSESVADALNNIGIIAEFAKSRTPNDKPHVERFLKTYNYSFIHKIKGTTLAKVGERIGFKSEDEACVTLDELDRLTHIWICSKYHVRPHSGLYGRAPIDVWNESAQSRPPQLKLNREDLDIEFSNYTNSALQHYGIDLNNSVYVSTRLLGLRRMLPKGTRVDVKWPSTDAGHIFVWDPIEEEYFKVPNKDAQFDGLTVDQSNLARKEKSAGDPNYQMTRASAGAIVKEVISKAAQDKKLKGRRAASKLANKTSKESREPLVPILNEETDDDDHFTPVEVSQAFAIEVELPEEV